MNYFERVGGMEIREAQRIIYEKYYERDHARGLYATFTWFVEEVGELAETLLKQDLKSMEEEIADVFAWLLSIANLVGVDVEKAFRKKYLS
jgi:NTP pyrophosphatase (non-canonical NTP hydrolase)